jgi:thioredoxin 1
MNGARARRLATSFILEMRGTARSRRRAGPCVGGFRHGARAAAARDSCISTKVLFFVIVAPMRNLKSLILSAAAILSIGVQTPGAAALPDIYPDPGKAKTDLAAALQTAAANHRRIIVDFGGNWCTDCHVLDGYFHDATNGPILEADFLVVHVNIGRMDQNLDLAERYQIPLKKGVPALAVLDSDGRLLYSQRTGEFEAMRRMQSSAVTEFLTQWKPVAPAGNTRSGS